MWCLRWNTIESYWKLQKISRKEKNERDFFLSKTWFNLLVETDNNQASGNIQFHVWAFVETCFPMQPWLFRFSRNWVIFGICNCSAIFYSKRSTFTMLEIFERINFFLIYFWKWVNGAFQIKCESHDKLLHQMTNSTTLYIYSLIATYWMFRPKRSQINLITRSSSTCKFLMTWIYNIVRE